MTTEEEKFVEAKLYEVHADIKDMFVKVLESNDEYWKDLLAAVPTSESKKFTQRVLSPGNNRTSAKTLVSELESRGCTVSLLITYLEAIKLEPGLMIFKPDVPLEIKEEPPENVEVQSGAPLHLKCTASGFPTPTFQWFKDGKELLQQNEAQLVITKASLEDAGQYVCQVQTYNRLKRTEQEPVQSRSCQVKVFKPFVPDLPPEEKSFRSPRIIMQPESPSERLRQSASVVLQCKAIGELPIEYKWFKDKKQILGETEDELLVKNLFPETDGTKTWTYSCAVSNRFGSVISDTVTLTLSDPDRNSKFEAKDKVALVIANEKYHHQQRFILPSSDAATLSGILKASGFRVMSYLDLTLSEMRNALQLFRTQLGKGVYGVFYFAGHGIEESGQLYMQPVDASTDCMPNESLSVECVAQQMQKQDPAFCFLLLDMCRERPTSNRRDTGPVHNYQTEPFKNILIGCATSYLGGAIEIDGEKNGRFMTYMKKNLIPEADVWTAFREVTRAMEADKLAQEQHQTPWISGNHCQNRTLGDPILCPRPENAKYDSLWTRVCASPPGKHFRIESFDFYVIFEQHMKTFCNALTMKVFYRDGRAEQRPIMLEASFNPNLKNVDMETLPEQNLVVYTLKDMQKIQEEIQITINLGMERQSFEAYSFKLKRPVLYSLGLSRNMLGDNLHKSPSKTC